MKTFVHFSRGALISLVGGAFVAGAGEARADSTVNPVAAPAATVAPAPVAAEVATAPTPFTRDHLMSTLTRLVAAHFNLDGELQLELIRPWTPPARVATVWELNVLDYPAVATSSMMLRCRVLADAAPVAEANFVVRAQLWREAWVSKQPLTVGSAFDVGALEVRRVDLMRERDVLPAAVGDRSYIFARAIPAGRLLTWRDIARRPLVKKGELVEVAAVEGKLVVTMKALAMENGAQGDTVTVRNPESRKDFAAMVIAENRVQVRF